MRRHLCAGLLLLPTLLHADPVADLRARLQARAEKKERLSLADLGDYIPRSEAVLDRYAITLVASASVEAGPGLVVQLPTIGLQDVLDIGWAMAERDEASPEVPELPDWLSVNLGSFKVTGPTLDYDPRRLSRLRGQVTKEQVANTRVSRDQVLGLFSAEFGGPAFSFEVPLGEAKALEVDWSWTLGLTLTPADEDKLALALTGKAGTRPPWIGDWIEAGELALALTWVPPKAGSVGLSVTLGGREEWGVPGLTFGASLPFDESGAQAPEVAVDLSGKPLLEVLLWVWTMIPPEALPRGNPRELLKWPAFAPASLDPASLVIPALTLKFPLPGGGGSSDGDASGPRISLAGVFGGSPMHGLLGPGGFRVDLPGGGDWTVPGVPWLGLKKTEPQLVLGGRAGLGLALRGENTLGGKRVQMAVDIDLKGGVKPGVVDLRLPPGTTALATPDLVGLAREVRRLMAAAAGAVNLDPFAALPALPPLDLDLALQAPELTILPKGHPDAEEGGVRVHGELVVGGSSWGVLKGLADQDGLRLGSVDPRDLRLVLGKLVLELPAAANDLDLGLYVAASRPRPTPLMAKLQAGAKAGREHADFLGIRGLTAQDVTQALSVALDGTVTFTASGSTGLIPGKTLTLGTTISGGLGSVPAATLEGGIDSLSLLDLVRVANSLGTGKGIPEGGVPDAALLPSRRPGAPEGQVQVRLRAPAGFGFSGRLVVERREWFDASFDLGPGLVAASGSATSFAAGPVTIRDPSMDLRLVAGPTPPELAFAGGVTIAGDLVEYSGDVRYATSPGGQSFAFTTEIAGRYRAEVGYTLEAFPSPGAAVHAGLAGPGLDRLKDDLFGALGAAARAADAAVASLREASEDAQAKRQAKLDAVEDFRKTWDGRLRSYVAKLADLDDANQRWEDRPLPWKNKAICDATAKCREARSGLEKARKAWDKATETYGEKAVKDWLKKYGKSKVVSKVLAYLPGYAALDKAVKDVEAAAQRASDDLAAKEKALLAPLDFSRALAGPTKAADMVVLHEAAFAGDAAGFAEGHGVTLEVRAALKGKPGSRHYQVPWGAGALPALAAQVMQDL